MNSLKIINARIWNGEDEDYAPEQTLLIEDGLIRDIGHSLGSADITINARGCAVLPGLIDAHFHAYAASVNIPHIESLPLSYLAHHGARLVTDALKRGFTTVRDAGGADWGLWKAIEDGLLTAPRLFYSGHALSQTGGHGDSRAQYEDPCGCMTKANLSLIADGVDEVRKAAREVLRQGAHQLKIFVSGGVSSPTDPIWMRQFSAEEIQVVVAEARSRASYVMAHAYTSDSIIHAVTNGVRSIEHGNMLDDEAARLMHTNGAFLVPTLVIYESLESEGKQLGLPDSAQEKLKDVASHGLKALSTARRHNLEIGFGTDLLGDLHKYQLKEFLIRSKVEKPIDTLRSATSVNARLLQKPDLLGCIKPGAHADLIFVEGDPLSDLKDFVSNGPRLVISRGRIVYENKDSTPSIRA